MRAAALPPPSSIHLAVLGLSRGWLLSGPLAMLLVLGAARVLCPVLALAAVHAAIAIGIAATIGVLAMILPAGLAMLCMVALMLGMFLLAVALMLRGRRALLVSLMGLNGLRNGRRSECESRSCGNEERLHVRIS